MKQFNTVHLIPDKTTEKRKNITLVKMNIAYIFAVLFCVSMVTGSPTGEASETEERAYVIKYTDGRSANIEIRGNEMKVEGPGDSKSVVDYDKHLITQMKPESKECLIIEFNEESVPSLDEITKDLQPSMQPQESPQQPQPTYDWPSEIRQMYIEDSQNPTKPELSELSRQLCEGSTTFEMYVEVDFEVSVARPEAFVFEDNIMLYNAIFLARTSVIAFSPAVAP